MGPKIAKTATMKLSKAHGALLKDGKLPQLLIKSYNLNSVKFGITMMALH